MPLRLSGCFKFAGYHVGATLCGRPRWDSKRLNFLQWYEGAIKCKIKIRIDLFFRICVYRGDVNCKQRTPCRGGALLLPKRQNWMNNKMGKIPEFVKHRKRSNDRIDQMSKLVKHRKRSNDRIDQMSKLVKHRNRSNDRIDQTSKLVKHRKRSNDRIDQMSKLVKHRNRSCIGIG